jgi:peptide/nickel transport system permease protein
MGEPHRTSMSGGGYVARFIARRIAAFAVLLVIISFGVFSLLYVAPGDTARLLLGAKPQSPAALAAVRQEYHLDKPFLTQYWLWLESAVQLDFGHSIQTQQSVIQIIENRAPIDVFLGVYAFLLVLLTAVPLGILAALRQRRMTDRAVVGLSVIGVSAPPFATSLLLLYLLSVKVTLFPSFGAGNGFVGRLYHLALPAVALAISAAALVVKFTRAAMINALDQDYVASARARGLSGSRVIIGYALRNALVPIVTATGLVLGYVLTGAVLIEYTFSLNGVGSYLVEAVGFKDFPVVQGIALLVAAIVMLANLLTDVAYLFVDPRIRYGATS